MPKPKKSYYCLPCGKHHGSLLLARSNGELVNQLHHKTCRSCRKRMEKEGYTAFHCQELNQTVWVGPGTGIHPDWERTLVLISPAQFKKLTGKET